MRSLALLLVALGCSAAAAPRSVPSAAPLHLAEASLGAFLRSRAPAAARFFGALRQAVEPRDDGALRFERFHGAEEITRTFAALERRHPRWFRARELGRSVEGRALPLLEVRDFAAPSAAVARALWVDGAIHGGELESAEVVLRVAEELRARIAAGAEPAYLRSVALYLAPVLNPDGRSRALADPPRRGRENAAPDGGVDLNRDFPARWSAAQARAADEPQPESAAVMRFWREHEEIALAASIHTSTTGFLQPPLPMSKGARARYDAVAALYAERLGLPRLSVPSHARGTTMDWFFAARGTVAFTLEIEGAHRPDAPAEERSERRLRAFLAHDLAALTHAHAAILLELAEGLAEEHATVPSSASPREEAGTAPRFQPRRS